MNTKFKATVLTMIAAIFNAGVLSILTLVYNNLIITHYGSSVNGLISTLNQFVSLFTVLEGGFIIAATVASYQPIVQKNYKQLNDILYTTSRYFDRIGAIFFVVAMVSGLIYLRFIKSPFNSGTTVTLLFITILTTTLSISVVSRFSIAINGHNKGYIKSIVAIVAKLATWMLSILFILNDLPIISVYIANFLNVILNIIILKTYEKKMYPEITYKGEYKTSLITGTKDVFFQKIASTVFSSTSLVLISVGINLAMASVYNLYNQIFHSVFNVLISIIESPTNSFGQLIKSDDYKRADYLFRIYIKLTQLVSTVFLVSVGTVIISFIEIYTHNVTDVNYLIPSLAILFYTQYFCQLNNRPYGLLLNAGGLFRMQNIQCGLSAIVNLLIAVIFMKYCGVLGVVIGSICGTLIILFMNVYQCYKHLLRGCWVRDVLWLICNYIAGVAIMAYPVFSEFRLPNYFVWAVCSCIAFIIVAILIFLVNYLFDREITVSTIKFLYERLLKKVLKK